jgi:hypothetical protein
LSKKGSTLESMSRILLLVLAAVLALEVSPLVLLFFIPVAGWFIWRSNDRIRELERKVATLSPEPQKSEDA